MQFKSNLILAVAAVFLIVACSDDDPAPQTVTFTGDNITGTWTTTCLGTSSISRTFSGGTSTFTMDVWFGDPTCTGTSSFTRTGTSTISFPGAETLATSEIASRMDVTRTARTQTINTDAAAILLAGSFGFTDWAAGTSHDILGKSAFDGAPEEVDRLQVVYVDNAASPVTLQLGDFSNPASTLTYPTLLNFFDIFTQ